MKKKIIVIMGPTASGKTNLSIKTAKKFGGFIISADSRQVYRGLDIGTAKITREEMKGIPHFMIDVADPKKKYTVAEYQKTTKKIIQYLGLRKSLSRTYEVHKLPIIVGGTGLYIDALINDWQLPEVAPNRKLRKELERKSEIELFQILKKLDPERAQKIDTKNKVRLIRSIEIAKALGKVPILKKSFPYKVLKIGIKITPEKLRQRLKKRLGQDLNRGLIEEVKKLHKSGLSWKRLYELGLEYSLVSKYLQNQLTKEELINQLKIRLWQYAKRQMTWFKRDKDIHWITRPKEAIDLIKKFTAS